MNNYLKIRKFYNESNLKAIEKKVGFAFKYAVIFILFVFVGLSMFFIEDTKSFALYVLSGYIAIITFIMCLQFYFSQKFISIYGKDIKGFLHEHKIYRRSERALIFFEKLVGEDIVVEVERNTTILDDEIELKKFDFLKLAYFVALFSVVGMLLSAIFSQLTLPWLFFLLFLSSLSIYFSWLGITMFRTEAAQMKDLKLFLLWYDNFGYELIVNNQVKDTNT